LPSTSPATNHYLEDLALQPAADAVDHGAADHRFTHRSVGAPAAAMTE
jgi:hypothetical protein